MIKDVFEKMKDVEPQNEKDYVRAGRWMVSRKLFLRAAAVIFFLSLAVLWSVRPEGGGTRGYPVYRYNSVLLKFRSGKTGILAAGGYTAYVGNVKKGAVQGAGTLYRKDGSVVYKGDFEASLYHGRGTRYRSNGTKIYRGQFQKGKRQGEGKLYNENDSLVYKGNFKDDDIVYEEMAGKKTEEVAEMYRGKLSVSSCNEEICGLMEEIDALYYGISSEDSMEGGFDIKGIYVLRDSFSAGGEKITEAAGLKEWFGKPEYAGSTRIEFGEAMAMNALRESSGISGAVPSVSKENILSDVSEVTYFDRTFKVYIRTYKKEGFRYTFYSRDKKSGFLFYSIEPEKE